MTQRLAAPSQPPFYQPAILTRATSDVPDELGLGAAYFSHHFILHFKCLGGFHYELIFKNRQGAVDRCRLLGSKRKDGRQQEEEDDDL